jgi:hypothetical protein
MDGGARAWKTLADKLRLEAISEYVPEPDLDHVDAIAHGKRSEPIARTNAELELGFDFTLPGFRVHPIFDLVGCSADAAVIDRYGPYPAPGAPVEIKCPLVLEKHMEVYRTQQMPAEHIPQVQCEIACYGARDGFFISYHPDAPHWKMRTVIVLVRRDDDYITRMLNRCSEFMRAIDEHRSPSAPAPRIPKLF